MTIFIVVLNWNGKEDTPKCLKSLRHLTYGDYKTVLVDNGSTDGSLEVIKNNFPELILIENGQNLGFAGGSNVGIKEALGRGGDYVLLLNNDTEVDPHLLEGFLEEKADILGAMVFKMDDRNTVDHFGGRWNPSIAEFESIKEGRESEEVDYVSGSSMFVKKEVFEKIGLLDERFFLIWEEADFCFRAKREGFSIKTAPHAKIWHKVSSSFVGGKPHTDYFWWRNRLLWIEKNLGLREKAAIFKIIFFEILKIHRHFFFKLISLPLSSLFQPQKALTRSLKLKRYRAGVRGIWDYFLRKFGKGPSWLEKKRS